MKPKRWPPFPVRRQAGIALMLVLFAIIVTTALVLAFFSSIQSQVTSSAIYSGAIESSALSDSAIQLVIGQIRDATNHGNGTRSWASQPGLIRTYNTSGNEAGSYKLYSASNMRPAGPFNPVTALADEIPADWAARPGEFVDLNTPMQRADGSYAFPILDPLDLTSAGNSTEVEGFGVTNLNFISSSNGAGNSTHTEIKMPVRWLYVLQSGAMAPLLEGKVAGASPSNPIIGRVAFWTDDETCKLNINTASHGIFHGKPYADTGSTTGTPANYTERRLGWALPVGNEFSRFPGHLAMTSLSPVLKSLWNADVYDFSGASYLALVDPYYQYVSPKTGSGGSKGASVRTTGASPFKPPSVTSSTKRLYATPDELAFGPDRSINGAGLLTPDFVSGRRFFLTSSSRAPEVTLFGTPRISLWPLQRDPDPVLGLRTRNTKDRLLAACSTINGKPFYFERGTVTAAAASPAASEDLDFSLSTWGANKLPDAFDPESHLAEGTRNASLYAYLQNITSRGVPGYAGSFADKYGTTNRDQLLTQMVDFMRSNINIQSANGMDFVYRYVADAPAYGNASDGGALRNQVTPLRPASGPAAGTKGLGCFSNLSGVTMVFLINSATVTGNGTSRTVTPTGMRCFLMFDSNNPLASALGVNWSGRLRVKGLESLSVTPQTGSSTQLYPSAPANGIEACLYFSRAGTSNVNGPDWLGSQFSNLRGNSLPNPGTNPYRLIGTNPLRDFTLCSTNIPLPAGGGSSFSFSGGNLTVEVYSSLAPQRPGQDRLVQSVNIPLPSGTWPMPRPVLIPVPAGGSDARLNSFNERANRRDSNSGAGGIGGWNKPPYWDDDPSFFDTPNQVTPYVGYMAYAGADVIKSVALDPDAATADYRLLASQREVPGSAFSGLPTGSSSYSGYTESTRSSYAFWDKSSCNTDKGSVDASKTILIPGTQFAQSNGTFSAVIPLTFDQKSPAGARLLGGDILGDWDTASGNFSDNSLGGRFDRGLTNQNYGGYFGAIASGDDPGVSMSTEGYSPNREISSAVSFGGLLTHSALNPRPRETLLFCANPAAGSGHPGFASPPDHLWLDLFTMPVVEPYASSLPFSTAGKVNMNYQIAPFTYIQRSTALRGALKSTWLTAIGTGESAAGRYKKNSNAIYRYAINPDVTLEGFDQKFQNGEIFRSATEICSMFLAPKGPLPGTGGPTTYSSIPSWWNNYAQTADNVREDPYGHLYPRLTTQSNSYTVHYRAQALKIPPSINYNVIDPAKLVVTSESRGSTLIERYVDASDPRMQEDGFDPATNFTTVDKYYKFRIVNNVAFAP